MGTLSYTAVILLLTLLLWWKSEAALFGHNEVVVPNFFFDFLIMKLHVPAILVLVIQLLYADVAVEPFCDFLENLLVTYCNYHK